MTAVAVDCAARDALKAKYAASIPAVCKIAGARVRGYVTGDSDTDCLVFRHTYY